MLNGSAHRGLHGHHKLKRRFERRTGVTNRHVELESQTLPRDSSDDGGGIPKGLRGSIDDPVFGEGTLWVTAWWTAKPMLDIRQGSRIKYASFTTREGKTTDELGPPRVQAERLEGLGEAAGETGGYATAQQESGKTLQWWPTVIDFPGPVRRTLVVHRLLDRLGVDVIRWA